MKNGSPFGAQLRQLRREQGLTQEMLAERVGCATQTIRKIEGGQRRPSYQIAARLAEELGIPAAERARFIGCSRDAPGDDEPADLPPTSPEPATPPARARTLPTPLTRLIGREEEVLDARRRLLREDVRLLTLLGAGGVGKTRLGIEVAAGIEPHFTDGVVFVNLVSISDPALVVAAIADAVGVGEAGGRTQIERLKEGLRAKRMLLVLDNFEQVISAAARVAELLCSCPGVKVLVTSRELLRVRGEHVVAVLPLPLPDVTGEPPDELLTHSAAVQLFAERAATVRPAFTLTSANAPAVAELCRRLDGLPLAIELAAARCTLLAPEAMVARLGSRLALLTGGPRDVPARQQALRTTIAWSYELLTPGEQELFRCLSSFIGGCTLDAIAAVYPAARHDERAAIEGVAGLIEKSLLWQEATESGEPRLVMLETIREYGLEQLEHSGEAEATRQAHARYFLQLVEQCEPQLWRGAQEQSLHRLEQEHGNLRAALAWYLGRDEGAVPALTMAGRLWRFWDVRGHWTEGQRWLEQALARRAEAPPEHRWVALHGAGNLALNRGEYQRAKAYYEESLAVTKELQLERGVANSLVNLSLLAMRQGELPQAVALQEQALAIHRALGNTIGIAMTLYNLASMYQQQGDDHRAAALAQECLTRYEELGDSRGTAWAMHVLALVARHCGARDHARSLLEQCRRRYEALGAKNDLARVLSDLGELLGDCGHLERARALLGESYRLAAELGDARREAEVLTSLDRLPARADHAGRTPQVQVAGLPARSAPCQRSRGRRVIGA